MILVFKTEGGHLCKLRLPSTWLCVVVRLYCKGISYGNVGSVLGGLGHVVDCLVGCLEEVLHDLMILLQECLHFLDKIVRI